MGVPLLARSVTFACLLFGVGFMIRASNVPLSVFLDLFSFHPTLLELSQKSVKLFEFPLN